jgi:hypothetical protein
MRIRFPLILFFFLFFGISILAQEVKSIAQDTVLNNKPELIDKKTKLGRFFNKLILKSNKRLVSNTPEIQNNQHLELGQGKIIRNINITTLDPFGYSDSDSLKKPDKKLEALGNNLHLKTKKFTIRNFLLFKEGDVFDSLKIRESERLIRTQRYVRRVSIYPIPITNSPDSVDILVRELDSWSIYPTGSLSTSSGRLRLNDRNFGGFGHDLTVQYQRRFSEKSDGYMFNYRVNNIQNTFVRTELQYNLDVWGNYIKSVAVDRPFYSPYAKWAAGASLYQRFLRDSLPDKSMTYKLQAFKYNTFDIWAGYSIPLFKKYDNQPVITNLRTSFRFNNQKFIESPEYAYDTLGYYRDQKTYLASISLSSINFIRDRFIFHYNLIEDVPVGKIFAITGGFKDQYRKRRSYFGAKLAMGGYTKLGYFATDLEWGSYFYGRHAEQGAFKFEGTYFTKLFIWGDWRFRHFFNPQLLVGYNRYDHVGDELRVESVIQGIRASKVTGIRRLSLAYQWQSYAPYEWKGFRFNPFLSLEGAFIGDGSKQFLDPKLYSRISLGFVANNDYLVFSSIAISLVYYPTMPDSGHSVFFANSRQYNVDLPSFNYARPQTVSYY